MRIKSLFTGIIFLITLVWVMAGRTGAFEGFPKGYDAAGHLGLVRIIRDNFPHIFWNPYWSGGTPILPRAYPPLYFFSLGILARLLPVSLTGLMNTVSLASVLLTVITLFGTVYLLTKKIFPSLFASLFLLSCLGFWTAIVEGGLHTRIFSLGLLSLTLFLLTGYLISTGFRKKLLFPLVVLSATAAFSAHFLTGLIVLGLVFLLPLFLVGDKKAKLWVPLRLMVFVVGLSSFWLVPYLVMLPHQQSLLGTFSEATYDPYPLRDFFNKDISVFPFFTLPLAFFLFVITLPLSIKKRTVLNLSTLFFLFALSFLLYSLGFFKLFLLGIYPPHMFMFIAYFLSIFFALRFSVVGLFGRKMVWFNFVIFAGVFIMVIAQTAKIKAKTVDYGRHENLAQSLSGLDPQKLYRFSNNDEVIAGLFNLENSSLQTRDYFSQLVLAPQYQNWLETGVYGADNLAETEYLLDWFAVNTFYPSIIATESKKLIYGKFQQKDLFALIGPNLYAYKDPSPLIQAVNSKPVLFVGQENSYQNFLYALALNNFNARFLIPCSVSRLNIGEEEMKRFPLVIVDETVTLTISQMASLKKYVENGGSVFFDTGKEKNSLPDPWPVEGIKKGQRKDWGFDPELSFDGDFEVKQFAPAVYEEGPWSIGLPTKIKPWAKVMLTSQSQPVIVAGQIGQGKVIWSGMGLLFHIKLYRNTAEAKLFEGLIEWLTGNLVESKPVGQEALFVNSQERRLKIVNQFSGVVLRESYFADWQATLASRGQNEKIRIYRAGPSMMYAFLPPYEAEAVVTFRYRVSFFEKICFATSFLTLIILFYWVSKKENEKST